MGNLQAQEIIPKQISQEMVDQDTAIARAVLDEFLENTTKIKEAMRDQLAGIAYLQRLVLREIAHTQTAKVFECLGFNNINKNSNEYIRQYNTKILTILLGHDIRKSEEDITKKESNAKQSTMVMLEGQMFLMFEEQCARIQDWMKKGKTTLIEELVDKDILLTPRTGPAPAKPNMKLVPECPKPKPQPENKPVMVKVEQKRDSGQRTPTDIWELKNRVALQRICLSQIRDGLQPTVKDQGIVFDKNNNAWLCPEPEKKKDEP